MRTDLFTSTRRGFMASMTIALAGPTLAAAPQTIGWDDLVPKDWDPMKSFQDLKNLGAMTDSNPRTQQLYTRLREIWDAAPTVSKMGGRQIRLPGYLVPLETGKEGLREFLLVPYFGACIHTPPPPANQIVHVRLASANRDLRAMDAFWVTGRLDVARSDSSMGVSGYSMRAARMQKY